METVVDRDVVVDGARIAYRNGGGDGRPVVLVHGTPSHSYIWREVIPPLESAGYRVLCFDLLGYGRSERPLDRDTSVAAQARILERMLDFWGLEQADIVGHDIGGATAMILAVHKPERLGKLLLVEVAPQAAVGRGPVVRRVRRLAPEDRRDRRIRRRDA